MATNKIGLNDKKVVELVDQLNDLLANYQVHYQKLRGCHWNVRGNDFFTLHVKFEELYNNAQLTIDELAERVLTLGKSPYSTFKSYIEVSKIKEINTEGMPANKLVDAILEDFKKAEYELKWIIFADPTYTDAYQLLGWLYQYIDVRKNTITFPEGEKDAEVFESLYAKYFPYKYLEENIELYSQILQFLGPNYANKKAISDVHLNLANNYFLLSNYPKAFREYQEVEKLSKFILEKNRFENYRQRAVYYFNLARIHVYNGKTKESISYLKNVLELYYKNEYFPLLAKVGTKDIPELNNYLEDVKKKIALLNALLGLAYMELGMFTDAITSFSTSVSMNGKSDYINDISLYKTINWTIIN